MEAEYSRDPSPIAPSSADASAKVNGMGRFSSVVAPGLAFRRNVTGLANLWGKNPNIVPFTVYCHTAAFRKTISHWPGIDNKIFALRWHISCQLQRQRRCLLKKHQRRDDTSSFKAVMLMTCERLIPSFVCHNHFCLQRRGVGVLFAVFKYKNLRLLYLSFLCPAMITQKSRR